MFKLFLDDIREAPDRSWITIRNPNVLFDMVRILSQNRTLDAISLDNDLGEGYDEGYQVLNRIEELFSGYHPKFEIQVHTDNPVARKTMTATIDRMKERGMF